MIFWIFSGTFLLVSRKLELAVERIFIALKKIEFSEICEIFEMKKD